MFFVNATLKNKDSFHCCPSEDQGEQVIYSCEMQSVVCRIGSNSFSNNSFFKDKNANSFIY